MTDNTQLLEQIRQIVATGGNGMDDKTFKMLTLAVLSDIRTEQDALKAELAGKADKDHTHSDIEMLKKRDWYSLTVAIVIAIVTSALAWFKK